MSQTCSNCKHWHSTNNADVCRRYPPKIIDALFAGYMAEGDYDANEAARLATMWPAVRDDDTCGEWAPGTHYAAAH